MRRWIRVDAELTERLRDLSDAEFRAYVAAVTNAVWQPSPGRFASAKLLDATLDLAGSRLRKTVPRLIETGRLERLVDGSILVRGWTDWQRPTTSTERVRAFRARKRDAFPETGTPRGEIDIDVSVSPTAPADIPHGSKLEEVAGTWRPKADADG